MMAMTVHLWKRKKGANQARKGVIIVDASAEYHPVKNQNTLSDQHINKIVETVRAWREIEKYAHVATFEEIRENDFNFNIPRYVYTFERQRSISTLCCWRSNNWKRNLSKCGKKMAAMLKEIER